MIITTLFNALQQSFIFIPLTLGIYLTYSIIKVTDLTPDGTFVLGAAIFARLLTNGHSQLTSFVAALLGGALAGVGVCLLQRYAKINSLIASILAVFMLYSVNFAVMGQPNINLLDHNTLLGAMQNTHVFLFNGLLLIFAVLLLVAIYFLVNSRLGLRLRAFGSNRRLLAKLGKYPTMYLAIGLALGNMFAALAGVLTSQVDGYADIHMGLGMALTGIGAVVIGCKLMSSLFVRHQAFSLVTELVGCVVGTYLYFIILNAFLALGVNPIYLKLFLGLILAVFLSTANYAKKGYHLEEVQT